MKTAAQLIADLQQLPPDTLVTIYATADQAEWYHHVGDVEAPGEDAMTAVINLAGSFDARFPTVDVTVTEILTVGSRVRLVRTDDAHTHLRPGDEGTVTRITDPDDAEFRYVPSRTIDVQWDSGSMLSMIPDAGDQIVLVERGRQIELIAITPRRPT